MQYAVANGIVRWARPEATLTTRPRDSAARASAAAVTRQGPSRLTSRTASASSPGGAPALCGMPIPAQLIEHVEAAQPLDRLGDRGVDRRLVADVAAR